MASYPISELNKVVRGPKRAIYDKKQIDEILDATFLCHVGYIYDDKSIIIPTAYGRDGDIMYIHGSLKNRMMTNLLKMGEASITVTHLDGLVLARSAFHHSANYRSVSIFGSVRQVEEPKEKIRALACILNHMVAGHWDTIRQPNKKEFDATLVLAIKIEIASAKVRAEGVVDEKEDHHLPIWAGVVPIKQVAEHPVSASDLSKEIKIPDSVLAYVSKNSKL